MPPTERKARLAAARRVIAESAPIADEARSNSGEPGFQPEFDKELPERRFVSTSYQPK